MGFCSHLTISFFILDCTCTCFTLHLAVKKNCFVNADDFTSVTAIQFLISQTLYATFSRPMELRIFVLFIRTHFIYVLYYILHFTEYVNAKILYHIVLHCIVSYRIVSYCIVSYCIALYRIVSHSIISYRIVL
jgi:hypothetical protein